MNYKFTLLASITAVFFSACQAVPSSKQSETVLVDAAKQQSILEAYVWSSVSKKSEKPVQLLFQQNRLAINAGCNVMGTPYTLGAQSLQMQSIFSTKMACSDSVMQQEQSISTFFQNQQLNYFIQQRVGQSPLLILSNKDAVQLTFVAQEKPDHQFQSPATILYWEIQPQTVSCQGMLAQQCLKVREVVYDKQGAKIRTGEWQNFYDQIEGYQHNPQQRVILRIKRFERKNVAADQSKYVYVKDLVVEQAAQN